MTLITRVTYVYCDASNFKFRAEFDIAGALGLSDVKQYLFDGEFFVPQEVGLCHLLTQPFGTDDHQLHALEEFCFVDHGTPICSAKGFKQRFHDAHERGWFSSFARGRYFESDAFLTKNR